MPPIPRVPAPCTAEVQRILAWAASANLSVSAELADLQRGPQLVSGREVRPAYGEPRADAQMWRGADELLSLHSESAMRDGDDDCVQGDGHEHAAECHRLNRSKLLIHKPDVLFIRWYAASSALRYG